MVDERSKGEGGRTKSVDLANDDLERAEQARVKLGRLVDPLVVRRDELLVRLDVLRLDAVLCGVGRAVSEVYREGSGEAADFGTRG